jgi:hypothetical protein
MPFREMLYRLYRSNRDEAYHEGTSFVLTQHPYLSGYRAPMGRLDSFVAYMQSKTDVWFTTCAQTAEYVKGASPK